MELLYDNNRRFLPEAERPRQVLIWDETLRDGEQSPGVAFHQEEKRALAQALAAAGVAVIDAGMPIISEDERAAIRGIVELGLPCEVGATVRTHEADLRAAAACGVSHVYMFFSVSPLHMWCKFGLRDYTALADRVCRHVELAQTLGLHVTFIAEDSTGADPDLLCTLFARVTEAGLERAIVCDTAVRMPAPLAFFRFCQYLRAHTPPALALGVHCHNDLGDANANTVLAVLAGLTLPTVTVNGIGERAGNAPLEQTVMTLEKMGIHTGVDPRALPALSRLVQEISGIPIQMHSPVVGVNAFRHESGIHADGVLEDPRTYETILPDEVGRERELIFGKHSGRHQLEHLLAMHNLPQSPVLVERLLTTVKTLKEEQSHRPLAQMLEELDAYYRTQFGIPEAQILSLAKELLAHDNLLTPAA
jgi:isopropylmalate/homocitrate/citramalate synthase